MAKKFFVVLLIVVVAAGCGNSGPIPGGVVTRAISVHPNWLNPLLPGDSNGIESLIFEGLLAYDQDMHLRGRLAQGWDISPDNLVWTFYLREDVLWHDGVPFTASDVEFTFQTIVFDPSYPGERGFGLAALAEVVAIDSHTVQFVLNEPYGPLMHYLTMPILPRHLYDPQVAAANGAVAAMADHPHNWEPVGTGPFKFQEWGDDHIILSRNEEYYLTDAKGLTLPYLETVVFKIIPDYHRALAALEEGEIDVLDQVPLDMVAAVADKLAESHVLYTYQDLGLELLCLNFRPDAFGAGKVNPFRDIRVRRAIAHALDRQHMVETVFLGQGVVMNSHILPGSWAYTEAADRGYEYDPDRAGQLLDEAGWKLGLDGWRYNSSGQKFSFTLLVRADDNLRQQIAEKVRDDLAEVGIEVAISLVSWGAMLTKYILPGKFQMLLLAWQISPEPDLYPLYHSSQENRLNFGAYHNSYLDALLEAGRQLVCPEQRREKYARIQAELASDLPYIYLFSRQTVSVARKEIGGIIACPVAVTQMENWYLKKN